MLRKAFVYASIALAFAAATMFASTGAAAQTIPGISDAQLAKAHILKGCHLVGASSSVQSVFGSYALAVGGSGHIPQTFFPGGAPVTADTGVVWCRFNRVVDYASDFMLVRYQVYSSAYAARKGFDLVVDMQNRATPDNGYTVSSGGSLTIATRKYGEIMAISGDTLASAAWYVPGQQPDLINRNVAGAKLTPMMFALLCPNAAPSC